MTSPNGEDSLRAVLSHAPLGARPDPPMFPSRFQRIRARLSAGVVWLLVGASIASAGDAYKWSLHYLIDNSRTVFGRPQKVSPRHNRGLAMSPDGQYLYAGYHHSFNNSGEVRRIRIDAKDFERATEAILPGYTSKALATDDKGRVYICDEASVVIYDAALEQRLLRIPATVCEGVATTREAGQLVLYATDREEGTLSRYVLQEADGGLAGAKLEGFDGTGIFKIPGANDLRGVKVDARGLVWVADLKGNRVIRIAPATRDIKSVSVPMPMDVAIDRQRVFVSRSTDRVITVLDDEMNVLGTLPIPWEELALSPFGNNRHGSLSGIVAVPGSGFFVANEAGQTANQRSTYGRIDDHSGMLREVAYRDVFGDDNEPILRATEVEGAR